MNISHEKVMKHLKDLPNEELIRLGSVLGVSHFKLERYKHQDDLCYCIVAAWLRAEGDVLRKSGRPSWERLTKALEEICENGIKQDIIKEHCKDTFV